MIASGGIGSSANTGAKENVLFDFYDDWEDDGDDLFGSKASAGGAKGRGEGIDEEDRRFFEELSKGLNAKEEDKPMERNELMDDTRATW